MFTLTKYNPLGPNIPKLLTLMSKIAEKYPDGEPAIEAAKLIISGIKVFCGIVGMITTADEWAQNDYDFGVNVFCDAWETLNSQGNLAAMHFIEKNKEPLSFAISKLSEDPRNPKSPKFDPNLVRDFGELRNKIRNQLSKIFAWKSKWFDRLFGAVVIGIGLGFLSACGLFFGEVAIAAFFPQFWSAEMVYAGVAVSGAFLFGFTKKMSQDQDKSALLKASMELIRQANNSRHAQTVHEGKELELATLTI